MKIAAPLLTGSVLWAAISTPAGAVDILAADADRIVTGASVDDQLGRSVAVIGDVDGDGWADFAVASFAVDAGRVTVHSGQTGGIIHTLDGEASGDSFGEDLAAAGDVDADGVADIIVGAWANDAGGAAAGRAYVFSGSDGGLLHTFTGDAAGDNLGDAVGGAGDVDADGHDDVVVGAPTNDLAGTNAGRVYVFSGLDGSPLFTVEGETELDRLGVSVCGAGDVDCDGHADVIAGAHLYGTSPSSADNPGRAYIFSGLDGTEIDHFTGQAAGDNFGWAVSGAGDANGDDVADVVVGAPLNDALGSNTGRAYVYSGSDGALLRVLTGESGGDRLGLNVSGPGDVDGDGFDDVLTGAWFNDAGGPSGDDRGRAYVFSVQTGAMLIRITGEAVDDHFGRPVHGGDVDGDGTGDVLVGARDNDAGGSDAGRAYLFLSTDTVCAPDLDDSGAVDVGDLLAVLGAWGVCPSSCDCQEDLVVNGAIDVSDLLEVLAEWGGCR